MAPAAKKQRLSNGGAAVVEMTDTEERQLDTNQLESNDKNSEKQEQHRRSLFVRSLPATTTSESLTELFSESYPIKHATAVIDSATGQCRGYGFVTFADIDDAQRARAEFNGRIWQDRKLRIEIAEPRHRESGAVKEPKPKPERETQLPPKLIVRNLPWSIKGSNQLEKLFQPYGKIKQAYVPKKGAGLTAGFGFVIMRGRKNAEKAIEGVNGREVDGRTLAVDWAVEKNVYQNIQQQEAEQGSNLAEERVGDEDRDMDDATDGNEWNQKDDRGEEDESDASAYQDDEESIDENSDVENGEDEAEGDEEANAQAAKSEDRSNSLFIRNLPFTCTDEDLEDHFTQFGSVRYARVVMDPATDRSKGTGFVCFYNKEDANACLRNAPMRTIPSDADKSKIANPTQSVPSVLQNENADLTGQYTLDGRVLQVSRAVDKSEANRLNEESAAARRKRNEDKRRLYLLSEGTISSKSKLWDKLSPSERTMRDASTKQRKTLIENNPSLHLSLTRLSVRNIPRSIDSKELKALARESVVGFATDVKNGVRNKLSKEELARGGEEMAAAEAARKRAGKGVVKQAKIVFESAGGSKVDEKSGAGRSRGYGFIEYYTHRAALMGLRWLNGHAVDYKVKESGKGSKLRPSREEVQDRKKRLIVEFAIENAQVVMRRKEREQKARERSLAVQSGATTSAGHSDDNDDEARLAKSHTSKRERKDSGKSGLRKRKRSSDASDAVKPSKAGARSARSAEQAHGQARQPIDDKTARRNKIIGKKRAMRKARKGVKS